MRERGAASDGAGDVDGLRHFFDVRPFFKGGLRVGINAVRALDCVGDGKGNKDLWEKFMAYYSAVFAEGALTEREKALIALAVAHAIQCPYCIDAYAQASLEKGSNIEEMTEAVHVACAIRGGASLVHGVQMRNVADKLSM